MELIAFLISGVGFKSNKSLAINDLMGNLGVFLSSKIYNCEIQCIDVVYQIQRIENQKVTLPKPRVAKAKTYRASDVPGFPKDWPDRHVPVRLKVDYFVDFHVAADAEGVELRRALIEPFCRELLRTPKTIQKRIDLPALSTDLLEWAGGEPLSDSNSFR